MTEGPDGGGLKVAPGQTTFPIETEPTVIENTDRVLITHDALEHLTSALNSMYSPFFFLAAGVFLPTALTLLTVDLTPRSTAWYVGTAAASFLGAIVCLIKWLGDIDANRRIREQSNQTKIPSYTVVGIVKPPLATAAPAPNPDSPNT